MFIIKTAKRIEGMEHNLGVSGGLRVGGRRAESKVGVQQWPENQAGGVGDSCSAPFLHAGRTTNTYGSTFYKHHSLLVQKVKTGCRRTHFSLGDREEEYFCPQSSVHNSEIQKAHQAHLGDKPHLNCPEFRMFLIPVNTHTSHWRNNHFYYKMLPKAH